MRGVGKGGGWSLFVDPVFVKKRANVIKLMYTVQNKKNTKTYMHKNKISLAFCITNNKKYGRSVITDTIHFSDNDTNL